MFDTARRHAEPSAPATVGGAGAPAVQNLEAESSMLSNAAPESSPTSEPSPSTAPGLPAVIGPRTPSALERLSVVAFFAACAALAWQIWGLTSGGAWLGLTAVMALGFVLADLVSGLVHWGFDTWGRRDTLILGPTFIVPFRVHHDDPMDITRHGFAATNGHNCFVSLLVLVPALLLPGAWAVTPFVQALLLSMSLGVLATNQFHKWSHMEQVSPFVARLQAWHIVLGREHHQVHHSFPYHRHYCITTGWLNRPLDAIGFFRKLEWAIEKVTGVAPREDDLGHTPPPGEQPAPPAPQA